MHIPLSLSLLLFPLLTPATPTPNPRSATGSWLFRLSRTYGDDGYYAQIVFANYTSDSYPGGLVSNCRYVRDPRTKPPTNVAGCDRKEFSWGYDNSVVKLQQVLENPIAMTVFGEAPLTLAPDVSGRTLKGSVEVVVTSAIA